MSKYKEGDKIVLEIISGEAYGDYLAGSKEQNWWFNAEGLERGSEPLSTYTEPLEAKIRRQATEITRLLAENKRLKAENGNSLWNIEQARAEGQNEAWELAKKCMLMTDLERETIFGSGHNALYGVLTYFDYKHAAAKVAEWEKAKEEIKVGDIVSDGLGSIALVVRNAGSMLYLVFSDGSCGRHEPESWHKTGRHIDIDSFLKQIGGEQE